MTNFVNRQLGTNYNKKRIRRLMKILGIRSVIRRVRQSCTKKVEKDFTKKTSLIVISPQQLPIRNGARM
ncbi:Mobile element protein [Streptococcus gallolyticus]|uniref:Mobile element protein n=1 Tax=Streptococcus gallolyticus TaxID=315405 RepID=A0A139MAW9_9STRE|nr:Mobile element protein [Streptococcus gallolyticus]